MRPPEGSGEPQGGAPVKPLEVGERVLLQDAKGRRHLLTLERGATFHTHRGRLAHDQLIGAAEGSVARTDLGQRLLALRPTLADWVVKMPRGAQVIYPRVLALMVMAADVRRVADLLARLEVLPGAVLVIRDGALLTSQDELRDGDKVEVRFAISGGC